MSDADRLQQEWREEVRESFRDLRTELREFRTQLEPRLRDLEDTKTKAIGFVSGIQMLGLAATWVMAKVFRE